jgi:cytochrome c biogenesis protein CcdA
MKKIVSRFKNRLQDFKINFKKKFQESKEKPKSKRKSFIIGFTTAVGIFGLTLFGPALSAVAKDIQNLLTLLQLHLYHLGKKLFTLVYLV